MHSVLVIGGSDNSSGAGIQADIKALNTIGVHCFTAITCITSQNSKNVFSIYKLPIKEIESQIDTILNDFSLKIVKTGMLYDEEIVKLVAKKIKQYDLIAIVDPVMKASVGNELTKNNFLKALKENLLQKTFLLTPNIFEVGKILNWKIKTKEDMKKACKEIFSLGVKNVLIKGGHLKEKATDVFYDGEYEFYSSDKLNKKLHGTGCSFSSLIAGNLAKGNSLKDSICLAKESITKMIKSSYKLGNFEFLNSNVLSSSNKSDERNVIKNSNESPTKFGESCYKNSIESTNFQRNLERVAIKNSNEIIRQKSKKDLSSSNEPQKNSEKYFVLKEVKETAKQLEKILPIDFIPEVGINICFALKNAKTHEEVCGIEGRIIKVGKEVKAIGNADFNVSKHVATIVLTVMKYDKEKRCAMNIKYSEENLKKVKNAKLKIGCFNREDEPKNVSTMNWGTEFAIKKFGITDVIYDKGGIGKEAMIRIIGNNPKDVLEKLKRIIEIQNVS